jgi:hypothetical protein
LEQRIARAWRKNQTRPVTVINLVSENTIESRMLDTLASKQALADGVLDLRGDLAKVTMRGGRQAFLARLEQLVAPVPQPDAVARKAERKPLPVDRGRAFADRAVELLRGAALRCEERYPLDGPHSVIVVVVERDAGSWRERLASLHGEFFGPAVSDPLAPVQLEVIDRQTDEAIRRMVEAGLVQTATRVVRPLYPPGISNTGTTALTEAERARLETFRQAAARKMKMARALLAEELAEEGREALLQALVAQAKALSVEHRLPEPGDPAQAVRSPVGPFWGEHHAAIVDYVADTAKPWKPVLESLQALAAQSDRECVAASGIRT